MKRLSPLLLILFFTSSSCSVESEKINYGQESCHFCKMTIVDTQHAAQAVTTKGKVYKFDSIECMINYMKQHSETEMALLYVNDYSLPGKLIDAKTATFLISKNIKSPMGAFLSAFENKETAKKMVDKNGGQIYNWQDVQPLLTN